MEELSITINPDGATEVQVKCVKGKACKAVTKAIEEALGRTTKDAPTSEMYEVQHATVKR